MLEARDECALECRRHVGVVEDAKRERGIPAWAWAVPPGAFDSRVLDQDRIWVTGDAEVLRLGEMSAAHLAAVQAMLADRATLLHLNAMVDALALALAREPGDPPTAEEVAHAATGSSMADLTPEEWLATTALWRAIERVLRARGRGTGE
jgi:hypothetical protein